MCPGEIPSSLIFKKPKQKIYPGSWNPYVGQSLGCDTASRKILIKLLGVVNVFEDHSSEVEARLLSFLLADLKNDAVHCNMEEFRSSHGHVTQRSSVVKLYLTKTKQIMIIQVQNHKPSPNIQIDLP